MLGDCWCEKGRGVSCENVDDWNEFENEIDDGGNGSEGELDCTAVGESECEESEDKVGYAGMLGIDVGEDCERLGNCEACIDTSWSIF